jgi:hypothetical protein
MKNADKPIYPLQYEGFPSIDEVVEAGRVVGLTKREYFAGLAMQGLLSNIEWIKTMPIHNDWDEYRTRLSGAAIDMADVLLKQLGE